MFGGGEVAETRRIGKQVVITIGVKGKRTLSLAVHLRMTGRLLWEPSKNDVQRHTRAVLDFGTQRLALVDVRRFATLRLENDALKLTPAGVDPTSSEFTQKLFANLISGSTSKGGATPIKPWLLRQDKIVGIGNIYASEICYLAGISPLRPIGKLKSEEIIQLHKAVLKILLKAIKHCGTTFSDFQDSRGEIGSYQKYLRVYLREGEDCRRCGKLIQRIVQQQRSTFFCNGCQR